MKGSLILPWKPKSRNTNYIWANSPVFSGEIREEKS